VIEVSGYAALQKIWFNLFLFFQHNEAVHRLYDSLQERIGSQQDAPHVATNMDHLDSPLMSVPTPAPL
jgi:hypothetical protein